MARTVDDIIEEMLTAKAADAVLSGLDSTSLKSIFYLMIVFFAQAQYLLEVMWDAKKEELQAIAAGAQPPTEKWLASRCLEFQYGHALIEEDGRLYYLVVDEAAQIIKKVAVTSNDGLVTIKAAKESGSELIKLSAAEKVAFQSYVNNIKPAGTNTAIISIDPDLVKLSGVKIYYDGKLELSALKTVVEAAISQYLNGIFFDGVFNINRFRDAIEAVEGVNDVDVTQVEIKPDGGAYVAVTRNYSPASGYFKPDPTFPFSDTAQIEYLAQ